MRISSSEREDLTANLALLLKAAMPIGEAVESIADTSDSRRLKKALRKVSLDIDEGEPLSKALKKAKIVTSQTLSLIEAGEQSGTLAANLKLASEQERKLRLFKSKLRSAMMYPVFVLIVTTVVGLGISWFLLPRLATTFQQMDVELPLITRIMIECGVYLQENGAWVIPTIIASACGVASLVASVPFLRHTFQRALLHIPIVGKLLREVEIARMGYMLGSLLDAGIHVVPALEHLEKSSSSPTYKKFYHQLRVNLQSGHSFRQTFATYKHVNKLIPSNARQIIIAGEKSGSLAETLRLVGSTYDEKVEVTTKNFEVIIEPVLLVCVWLGVMAVAIGVILPVYSLVGGL